MRCACGGESEVLERRGARRRRRCKVCGARWTTVEVRVSVKSPALPPQLANLAKQAKHAKQARQHVSIRQRTRQSLDDAEFNDEQEDLTALFPEGLPHER